MEQQESFKSSRNHFTFSCAFFQPKANQMPPTVRVRNDYSPVHWLQYFDEAFDIPIRHHDDQVNKTSNNGQDSFRVYLKNFGGSFAPRRKLGHAIESELVEISNDELKKYNQVPTLVTLHGGGYSGLTWAKFVKHIDRYCESRILSIDLRGHGDTKTSSDDKMDIDTLVSDVFSVVNSTHQLCGFPETPKIVLIGHSMGGAIAVKCATKCTEYLPSLAGFVVIDVVEGTAVDALPLMMSVIKTRPTRFPNLNNAIEWTVRSGMAKNSEAARVSVPGNLLNISSGQLAIHDVNPMNELDSDTRDMLMNVKCNKFHISLDNLMSCQALPAALLPKPAISPRVALLKGAQLPPPIPPTHAEINPELTLHEEQDETEVSCDKIETKPKDDSADSCKKPPDVDTTGYCWRSNLPKTRPYWDGWFEGLSNQMLSAPVQGKFLLLAGIDRLDKALTIGHMQGKFMMKVLPKCGHAVQEDVPEQVASAIGDFLVRNKFAEANKN